MIYLDNSAATRMDERVHEAMLPYFFEKYAVATSEFGYSLGIEAREALDKARSDISSIIGADEDEIIFTSGDTEASNMALKGVAYSQTRKGRHIIVSKIEDFPVLNTARALERDGFKVTYLPVDSEGLVDPEELKKSITKETVLVSVQHSNQEIGTVQDIEVIGKICRDSGIPFHTDATHTFGRVPLDMKKLPVDLMTISSHTLHGPKGVGALFKRKDVPIQKWMDGGYQEFNLRAGLENIPGIVGFAKAAELMNEEENMRIKGMRDRLIDKVMNGIPDTTLNGHRTKRLPQNANITFHMVEGESMTLHLDMRGIEVSTGSACFSRSLEASHVIMGIGGDHERAHGSIRFTFGRYNNEEEVDVVVEAMKEIVSRLREISPLKR
ncbi:MAG: cysteine desulfurase [Methanomassiliicoccales archaeon]|nr:MAG: cysteine desulfurase [Methanomassiliicoccales archaeon]